MKYATKMKIDDVLDKVIYYFFLPWIMIITPITEKYEEWKRARIYTMGYMNRMADKVIDEITYYGDLFYIPTKEIGVNKSNGYALVLGAGNFYKWRDNKDADKIRSFYRNQKDDWESILKIKGQLMTLEEKERDILESEWICSYDREWKIIKESEVYKISKQK